MPPRVKRGLLYGFLVAVLHLSAFYVCESRYGSASGRYDRFLGPAARVLALPLGLFAGDISAMLPRAWRDYVSSQLFFTNSFLWGLGVLMVALTEPSGKKSSVDEGENDQAKS